MLFFKPEFNLNFYLPISYVNDAYYNFIFRLTKILKGQKKEML